MTRVLRLLPVACLLAAPAMAQEIQPGMWENTSTMTGAEIPGAPPEMLSALLGQANTMSSCLTQEQLDEGPEALFNQSDGQCVFDEFSMQGGRISFTGSCSGAQGAGTVALTGTYTATSYETESVITGATPGGQMRMTVAGSGRRTGDC